MATQGQNNGAPDGARNGQSGDDLAKAAEEEWGASGLSYRGPEDAVDGLQGLLEMLNTFLSVIGIAALVAGGVGIAQACAAFLQSRGIQSVGR